MTDDAFERALRQALPAGAVSRDASDLEEYGRDRTRIEPPRPRAVAFPTKTDQVSHVVRLCNEHRVGVVPSGGRTGLAGGALAANGELVLSLERMRRIDAVDTVGATVRVQAGAVTRAVHDHCEREGLTWPIDFASKGSSQVGGNIATNAGGVKVIRYGLTRQWVLGLQVVTPTGDVLELRGALEKNNTGLDLRQLFIGSEGTLGVVTEATLKLARLPHRTDVGLFGVRDVPGVLALFEAARKGPFTVSAYEMFSERCLARVERHLGLRAPLSTRPAYYALLEVEDADRSSLETWLASMLERKLADDGSLASSTQQAERLWTYREGISESLSATGFPHKNDVSLPIARLSDFCSELASVFDERYRGWEICLFGHVGDGNLHVNVMKPDDMPHAEFVARTSDADRAIFELVRNHGGSISAEHGVGLLKKPYLGYTRSDAEIDVFRRIKTALDPNGIMNPGKVFD